MQEFDVSMASHDKLSDGRDRYRFPNERVVIVRTLADPGTFEVSVSYRGHRMRVEDFVEPRLRNTGSDKLYLDRRELQELFSAVSAVPH